MYTRHGTSWLRVIVITGLMSFLMFMTASSAMDENWILASAGLLAIIIWGILFRKGNL